MDGSIFTESDLKKFLVSTKQELHQECIGSDIPQNSNKVFDLYNGAPHKVVKLLSFPLISQLPDKSKLGELMSSIQQDIQNKDDEIQLNAMKLMPMLPTEQQIQLLKACNNSFIDIISNLTDYNYERLQMLHHYLFKLLLETPQNSSNSDCSNEVIQMYYLICQQIFSVNRNVSRNCIMIISHLFHEYSANWNGILFQVCGSNSSSREIMKQLIVRLSNVLIVRVDDLLNKILSFEVRIRHRFIISFISILAVILELSQHLYKYQHHLIESEFMKQDILFQQQQQQNDKEMMQQQQNDKDQSSEVNIKQSSLLKMIEELFLSLDFQQIQYVGQDNNITNINAVISLLQLSFKYHLLPYHKYQQCIKQLFEIVYDIIKLNTHFRREYVIPIMKILKLQSNCGVQQSINISIRVIKLILQQSEELQQQQQYEYSLLQLLSCSNLIQSMMQLSVQNPHIFQRSSSPLKNILSEILLSQSQIQKKIQQNQINNLFQCLSLCVLNLKSSILQQSQQQQQFKYEFIISLIQQIISLYFHFSNTSDSTNSSREQYTKEIQWITTLIKESYNSGTMNQDQKASYISQLAQLAQLQKLNYFTKLLIYKAVIELESVIDLINESVQLIKQFVIQNKLPSFFLDAQSCTTEGFENGSKYYKLIIFSLDYLSLLAQYNKKNNNSHKDNKDILALLSDYSVYLNKVMLVKGVSNALIQSIMTNIKAVTDHINNLKYNNNKIYKSVPFNYDYLTEYEKYSYSDNHINKQADQLSYAFTTYLNLEQSQAEELFENYELSGPISYFPSTLPSLSPSPTKLISGILDPMQAYASHSINAYTKGIVIQLDLFNQTQFKLDNIKIKVKASENLEILQNNLNSQCIEEINPMHLHSNTFSFQFKPNPISSISTHACFDISINDSNSMQTIQYHINMIDLIVPNTQIHISPYLFEEITSNLIFSISKNADLLVDIIRLANSLKQQNSFACSSLDGLSSLTNNLLFGKQEKECNDIQMKQQIQLPKSKQPITLGMLGNTWDGIQIAIKIYGIQNIEGKSQKQQVQLVFQTSKLIIQKLLEEQLEELVESIFKGNLLLK